MVRARLLVPAGWCRFAKVPGLAATAVLISAGRGIGFVHASRSIQRRNSKRCNLSERKPMNVRRCAVMIGVVALLAETDSLASAQDGSWIGESVLYTKPAKEITF